MDHTVDDLRATAAAAAAANDQKSGGYRQQLQVIINDSVDGSFPQKQEKLSQEKEKMKGLWHFSN
jgi:hypothetical protein